MTGQKNRRHIRRQGLIIDRRSDNRICSISLTRSDKIRTVPTFSRRITDVSIRATGSAPAANNDGRTGAAITADVGRASDTSAGHAAAKDNAHRAIEKRYSVDEWFNGMVDAMITGWNRLVSGWTCQATRRKSDAVVARLDSAIEELHRQMGGKNDGR